MTTQKLHLYTDIIPIRWRDVDPYQHVNHSVFFTYITEGIRVQEQVTYQALDLKAKAIAAILQAISSRGNRALLLYPSGLAYIAAFFGCLYAGVVPVPVYPPSHNKPDRRLQAIIKDAGAALILSDTDIFNERDRRLVHTPVLMNLR